MVKTRNMPFIVLTKDQESVEWVLYASSRQIQRGTCLRTLPDVEPVVIADYSLLSNEDALNAFGEKRLALVQPGKDGRADVVAERWIVTPENRRAYLYPSRIRHLRLYLDQRTQVERSRQEQLERLRNQLLQVEPEYLEVFTKDDGLIPDALEYLRDYPSSRLIKTAGLLRLMRLVEGVDTGLDHGLPFRVHADHFGDAGAHDLKLSENMVSFGARQVLLLESQLRELDQLAYVAVAPHLHGYPGAESDAPVELSGAASRSIRRGRLSDQERRRVITEGLVARNAPQRDPKSAYALFRSLHLEHSELTNEDAAEVNTLGTLLALDSGNFYDAALYRVNTLRALYGEEGVETIKPSSRVYPAAILSSALAEALGGDPVAGCRDLRSAIAQTEAASPQGAPLESEARGLYALLLVLLSEIDGHPEAVGAMRHAVANTERGAGAARAASDIAEFFLAAVSPSTSLDAINALRKQADQHSSGTPYRAYYNWVVMLTTFMTKNIEQGLHAHAEIRREGVWPSHNPHFMRLARFAYSVHLAARGEFAAAWQELDSIAQDNSSELSSPEMSMYGLICVRLDLAAQNYRDALIETMPDSRSGIESLRGIHMHRYAPSSLMLRGSAFAQDGAHDVADQLFCQATELATLIPEWITLLSLETPEYRAWLESLDRDNLPIGLDVETYDGVLSRPIFISHSLPALTPQLRRVLHLIARGRSMGSIAAELHITNNTLKTHVKRLYSRLGVSTRQQASLKAASYRIG